MPLSVGIVGLPNAGKSTLFNALAAEFLNTESDIERKIEGSGSLFASLSKIKNGKAFYFA